MKINEKMRFPHPILCSWTDDHNSGELKAEFIRQLMPNDELHITSEFSVSSDFVANLLRDKKAEVGYFMSCPRTFYNKLITCGIGEFTHKFDVTDLFGRVSVRPIVWSSEEFSEQKPTSISDEYGNIIYLPRGGIIAIGQEFTFSADKQRFKPFETIFSIAIDDTVEDGTFSVDLGEDTISIKANKETNQKISSLRSSPVGRQILMSSVYFPVVIEVIASLQQDDGGLSGNRWHRVFIAKCDDLGIDLEDRNLSPLDAAQLLLKQPFERSFSAMDNLL